MTRFLILILILTFLQRSSEYKKRHVDNENELSIRENLLIDRGSKTLSRLGNLGINKTCQILDCVKEKNCAEVRAKEIYRIQLIEYHLLNGRCPHDLLYLQEDKHISDEERDFPLAFSIMLHKDFPQFLHLMEAIYREHNFYCIQIDLKAFPAFTRTVIALINCLKELSDNIFFAKRKFSFVWAHHNILEGDLACMEELLERDESWKYFMNLAGSEYPLKQNIEIIRDLSSINNEVGAIQLSLDITKIDNSIRWQNRWKYKWYLPSKKVDEHSRVGAFHKAKLSKTKKLKSPPPLELIIQKASKNIAITRHFAEMCVESDIAKDLRIWFQDTFAPDEHFFATLAVPYLESQGFNKTEIQQELTQVETRYSIWKFDTLGEFPCYGVVRRNICVLSIRDVPAILQKDVLFANKFDTEVDPTVVPCIRAMIYSED